MLSQTKGLFIKFTNLLHGNTVCFLSFFKNLAGSQLKTAPGPNPPLGAGLCDIIPRELVQYPDSGPSLREWDGKEVQRQLTH